MRCPFCMLQDCAFRNDTGEESLKKTLRKGRVFIIFVAHRRGVAQSGRASALGAECRQFESGYPEKKDFAKRSPFLLS